MTEARSEATADLPPAQVSVLRSLWQRRGGEEWLGATTEMLAQQSGFTYQQVWRACTSLHGRGYLDRVGSRGRPAWWRPNWAAIQVPHRVAICELLDYSTPDEAELVMGGPGFAVRLADWWFRHD
jgi:hypothetical protein